MELINGPFNGVKQALVNFFLFIPQWIITDGDSHIQKNGTAVSSFVSQGLENLAGLKTFDFETKNIDENYEESPEVLLKNAAGVAYSGASHLQSYFPDEPCVT